MSDHLAPWLARRLSETHRFQNVGNTSVECVPGAGNTDLANCDKLDQVLGKCNALSNQNAPKQDIIDCFCTQELLSAYVGCKNDMRLCSLSYTYDADFDSMIKDWSDTCQPYLASTTITTPAAITLTQTYDEQSCQTLYVSCKNLESTFSSCSSQHTQATDLSSCRCGSEVLALASACEIDGALQCARTTPDPSTLWAARYCSTTPVIPAESPVTPTAPLTTPTTPLTSSTAPVTAPGITTAPLTAPSISFGPASTSSSSTTTSAGDLSVKSPGLLVAVLAWGIVTWFAR